MFAKGIRIRSTPLQLHLINAFAEKPKRYAYTQAINRTKAKSECRRIQNLVAISVQINRLIRINVTALIEMFTNEIRKNVFRPQRVFCILPSCSRLPEGWTYSLHVYTLIQIACACMCWDWDLNTETKSNKRTTYIFYFISDSGIKTQHIRTEKLFPHTCEHA